MKGTVLIAGLGLLECGMCEKSLSRKDYGSAFMHCPVCGNVAVVQVWGMVRPGGGIDSIEYRHANSRGGVKCCIRKIRGKRNDIRGASL